jgi:hypothetical protein
LASIFLLTNNFVILDMDFWSTVLQDPPHATADLIKREPSEELSLEQVPWDQITTKSELEVKYYSVETGSWNDPGRSPPRYSVEPRESSGARATDELRNGAARKTDELVRSSGDRHTDELRNSIERQNSHASSEQDPPDFEWERVKPVILSAPSSARPITVITVLDQVYGFNTSLSAYRRKLQQWGRPIEYSEPIGEPDSKTLEQIEYEWFCGHYICSFQS